MGFGWKMCRIVEEDKCQAALITTRRTIGQYIYRLMSNNPQLTWNELKNYLGEYYEVLFNPNAWLIELTNIEQG